MNHSLISYVHRAKGLTNEDEPKAVLPTTSRPSGCWAFRERRSANDVGLYHVTRSDLNFRKLWSYVQLRSCSTSSTYTSRTGEITLDLDPNKPCLVNMWYCGALAKFLTWIIGVTNFLPVLPRIGVTTVAYTVLQLLQRAINRPDRPENVALLCSDIFYRPVSPFSAGVPLLPYMLNNFEHAYIRLWTQVWQQNCFWS